MPSSLKSTSEGQTLILTISNSEFKNALSPEIYAAGVEALNAAETNPEIRSVIITGEGTTFCAGGNLQRLLANRQNPKKFRPKALTACTAGLTRFVLTQNPLLRRLRAQLPGQDSHWRWLVTFV